MKTFIKLVLIAIPIMSINLSYASDINVDPEFMDDDSVDYNSPSVQTSSSDEENDSIETRERSEYNIDMRPYVNFRYVSSRTRIEHK